MSVLYFVIGYLVISFTIAHLYVWFEGGWYKWSSNVVSGFINWPFILVSLVCSKDGWRSGKAILPFLTWWGMRLLVLFLGVPLLTCIKIPWIYYPVSFVVLLILDFLWYIAATVNLTKNSA